MRIDTLRHTKPGLKRVLPSEQSEKCAFVPLGGEGIMGEVMRDLLELRGYP